MSDFRSFPLRRHYCPVKANYSLTSMNREVAAVSEAMLSFTDAGGFLRMIPCGQILITNKARLFMIIFIK